jgi:hydrogenase maturation protease
MPFNQQSNQTLIIGCGNLDRGDDAAGLLVVRRLRQLGVEAQEQNGESLKLIETWRGAQNVVLIDTVVTGRRIGKVTIWDATTDPLVGDPFHCSTHAFGVAGAVELARILGWLPSSLRIYGIEGKRFKIGTPPSPAVLRCVEQIAQQIACHTIPSLRYRPKSVGARRKDVRRKPREPRSTS